MCEVINEKQLATRAERLAHHDNYRVIHLKGDIGAGKTTFCKYFIRALAPDALVTSPTYPIIQEYQRKDNREFIIYHIDLYRMFHPHQVEELGLGELISDHSILLIEWPEKGVDFTPEADLIVSIDYVDNDYRSYSVSEILAH